MIKFFKQKILVEDEDDDKQFKKYYEYRKEKLQKAHSGRIF